MAVKQNYKNVLKYLEENNIDPKKALEIILKADPYNPNNIQARWKMKSFLMEFIENHRLRARTI